MWYFLSLFLFRFSPPLSSPTSAIHGRPAIPLQVLPYSNHLPSPSLYSPRVREPCSNQHWPTGWPSWPSYTRKRYVISCWRRRSRSSTQPAGHSTPLGGAQLRRSMHPPPQSRKRGSDSQKEKKKKAASHPVREGKEEMVVEMAGSFSFSCAHLPVGCVGRVLEPSPPVDVLQM